MIETVGNCGQGINTDLTPEELSAGVWSSAENVRFNNGYAERFLGMSQIFATPAVVPYWVAPFAVDATKYIVHMGLTAGYVDDGTTRTDITGTAPTGAIDDKWTGGTLGGIFYANNGKDNPMYWDGNVANNLVSLVGSGWTNTHKCKALRPFKNFLIALNITKGSVNYPHMVKWSVPAVPGAVPNSWDETNPALDAGENDLAETPDVLVDCLPMGNVNIVYKERSMYAMQFAEGSPYIFRFQRLPGDFGLLAAGCVVDTPVGHIVMSAGDIVLHTGGQPQSIANGAIRRYIFNNISQTVYRRSFVTSNPAKNEVWICFPFGGADTCNKAAVWNWIDKTWAIRDLVNATSGCVGQSTIVDTWDSDTGTWDEDATTWNESEYSPAESRLFMSHTTPLISLVDSGSTDFGSIITASMERTGITLGDPMRVKTITGIRPRIDGADGETVTIEVGGSMLPDKPPTWSAPVTFTLGQSIKADAFATGRFMSVRFGNVGYAQWRIRSFDVDFQPAGRF